MTRRGWLLAAAILIAAAALRFAMLTERPPHHDEGVNGWMVERMLEQGHYTYDPENYHGPSYFYVLAAAREALGFGLLELRAPAALMGILLCAAPLILRRRLGTARTLAACALLATSPTLVYYARYAIHETLLALLGLVATCALLRFAAQGRVVWLYVFGAALAGMIATKETTIIYVGVLGLWLGAETLVESVRERRLVVLGRPVRIRTATFLHLGGVLAVMALIHILAFTGGFQDSRGVGDALARSARAYLIWTKTGTGPTGHEKVWCYYLHLGLRYELVLYALATVGVLHGRRDRVIRGAGAVGFGLLAIYSWIPYKMPWLPTSWLALLAIPAGHGVLGFARVLAREVSSRIGWHVALVVAVVPALVVTIRSSFVRPSDARESLAYVHTVEDYDTWLALIERAGRTYGRERIQVATESDSMWPLPWSLSQYRPLRLVPEGNEHVIIAPVSRAADLEGRLRGSYFRRQYGFREAAEPVYVYFRRSVFARWLAEPTTDPASGYVLVGGSGVQVSAR